VQESTRQDLTRLASAARGAVEDGILRYEQDFARGRAGDLESYLPEGDTKLLRAALIELVKVDLELRWTANQPWSLDDYCRRYPLLGSDESLPADLIYEAYRLAKQHGDNVSLEQYCQRYPRQQVLLQHYAQQSNDRTRSLSANGRPLGAPEVGETIGDFHLLALLGKGAFAEVYLARQQSLGRHVALKVSANFGGEARTMASLEHDNIVQVFSEEVLAERNLRLLCMQYVPGATLGQVIDWLGQNKPDGFEGPDVLAAIDQISPHPAVFHPAALRDRRILESADLVTTLGWVGGRLAEALAYAHSQGVLHRDVKPDNVLINQYGRPMLADFNLSLEPQAQARESTGTFGGTLSYMSPEHLDAFNSADPTPHHVVREPADIYSLGVVLFELAVGQRPFGPPPPLPDQGSRLRALADQRRLGAPSARSQRPAVTIALDRIIRRCLAPEPEARFASADQLAARLDGARRLQAIDRELPPPGRLIRLALRFPITMLLLVTIAPHVVGSVVNITYNWLRIVAQLDQGQADVFHSLVAAYNLLAYSVCLLLIVRVPAPALRVWRRLRQHEDVPSQQIVAARQRVPTWASWATAVACLGWLPGGILFPLGIHLLAGPAKPEIFLHFFVSFALSGLIAMTYSFFGVELMATRVFYPRLLCDETDPREAARRELRNSGVRLRGFQFLAGVIPLAGALILLVAAQEGPGAVDSFRLLVMGLIVLGICGFALAILASTYLGQTLTALLGGPSAPGPRTDRH
jgi:serine/threonine protein kinase